MIFIHRELAAGDRILILIEGDPINSNLNRECKFGWNKANKKAGPIRAPLQFCLYELF